MGKVEGGILVVLVLAGLVGFVLKFARQLLPLVKPIDKMSYGTGVISDWCILLCCVISAGNATIRYLGFGSSNAWLEIQWYLFGVMVLLGGAYTLRVNEHVRVDLFYGMVSDRTRAWIDLLGGVVFLLPMCALFIYFSWPLFVESWRLNEASNNAGGLLRWPIKLVIPLGFALLAIQGVAEIIKRAAVLKGLYELEYSYEKPLQ